MLAVVTVLFVGAALFWFAHPLADDFARAYKGRVQGVVPATDLRIFHLVWPLGVLRPELLSNLIIGPRSLLPLLLVINPLLLGGAVMPNNLSTP